MPVPLFFYKGWMGFRQEKFMRFFQNLHFIHNFFIKIDRVFLKSGLVLPGVFLGSGKRDGLPIRIFSFSITVLTLFE